MYYQKYNLLPNDKNFEIMDLWFKLSQSAGWCYTFENIVFVCEKPCEISLNRDGELHKDNDMALKYSDGYGLYLLNGVEVPEWLVCKKKGQLSKVDFEKCESALVKKEFIKKLGLNKFQNILGKKKWLSFVSKRLNGLAVDQLLDEIVETI